MPPPEPRPARKSWLSIVLASVVGLLLFGGLLLMTANVAVAVAGAAIVCLLAFGFAAFHYLVWGWWLGDMIRREAEGDQESAEQDGEP